MNAHDHPILNWLANTLAGGAILTSILAWTPPTAAMIGMVYYVIKIWESPTIQVWIAKRRMRRLARLKAEVLMLETKIQPLPPEMED